MRIQHMLRKSLAFTLASLLLLADGSSARLHGASKTVNPNHQDVTLAMAIHGDALSDKLSDEAQGLYVSAAKVLKVALEREGTRQGNRLDPKALGDGYVAVLQLRRLAQQLQYLGEPAGVDYFQRSEALKGHFLRITQTVGGWPEGAAFLVKARAYIAKTAPDRANTLKKLVELARKNQWKEAESTMLSSIEKLRGITVFLTTEEQRQIHEPFSEVVDAIERQMAMIRLRESEVILNARKKALAPAFDELLERCDEVARALASGPQVDIEGQKLDGPAAFAALLTQWQKTHVQVQKYYAVSLAQSGHHEAGAILATMPMGPGGPNGPAAGDPIVGRYLTTFPTQIAKALAGVIDVQTKRASEAELEGLYTAHVQAAALIGMRAAQTPAAAAIHDALQRMAAKSPALKANVDAYDMATTEILRWRNRVAETQARVKMASYPAVETKFRPAFQSNEAQNYLGLFWFRDPEFEVPRLIQSAPDILLPRVGEFVGTKATVFEMRGVGAGKNIVSELQHRTYATMKGIRSEVAPAIAALKADLFVTDEAPPLTLPAAAAIASAEVGDWDACGGSIHGLHLEGFITRLGTLPEPAWSLIPLGTVPLHQSSTHGQSGFLPQAVVRFDVTPDWVQHRFFCVDATAAATETKVETESAAGAEPEGTVPKDAP
jgi:hypothetical protein